MSLGSREPLEARQKRRLRGRFLPIAGAAAALVALAGSATGRAAAPIAPAGSVPSGIVLSPTSGVVGSPVEVTGTGFTGATSVTFAGTQAVFTVVADTELATSVPYGAVTGKVTVTAPAGSGTSKRSFKVRPQVTGFSPTYGAPGTQVEITGIAIGDATDVIFGGAVPAPFIDTSYTRITATVPSGAILGKIKVVTPGGADAAPGLFHALVAGDPWYAPGYDATNTAYNPLESRLGPSNTATLSVAWKTRAGARKEVPTGSPVVRGGFAYVGSSSGIVYAFDAANGGLLWRAQASRVGVVSIVVADGRVHVLSADSLGGSLDAFDATTGARAWTASGSDFEGGMVVADGVIYLARGLHPNASLTAIDDATGAQLWTFASNLLYSPAVAGGIVYINDGDPHRGNSLYAVDTSSGREIWQSTGVEIDSGIAYSNGFLYATCDQADVCEFDASTGSLVWKSPASAFPSTPVVGAGRVFVATIGHEYAFDAVTGALAWTNDVDNGAGGGLIHDAGANGVYYMFGNSMYALDSSTGAPLWESPGVGGNPLAIWPVVTDGTLYVAGFENGRLELIAYRP